MKERISSSVEKTTILKLDNVRGMIPRSRIIEQLILDYSKKKESTSTKRQPRGGLS